MIRITIIEAEGEGAAKVVTEALDTLFRQPPVLDLEELIQRSPDGINFVLPEKVSPGEAAAQAESPATKSASAEPAKARGKGRVAIHSRRAVSDRRNDRRHDPRQVSMVGVFGRLHPRRRRHEADACSREGGTGEGGQAEGQELTAGERGVA